MLLSLLCCVGEQKVVFKVPPEPSLDFEVAGHLLGEGAVCDVRRLEPLAELGHGEDAFVGHPAPGIDSHISRGGGRGGTHLEQPFTSMLASCVKFLK